MLVSCQVRVQWVWFCLTMGTGCVQVCAVGKSRVTLLRFLQMYLKNLALQNSKLAMVVASFTI